MAEAYKLNENPVAEQIFLFAGWRQWADAGSVSSGLPQYLIQKMGAHKIGQIYPDGFYLFQIPGTHDLLRPVVKFKHGYPESLTTQTNEFYYAGDEKRGLVFFIGDEPHIDIERYVSTFLQAARALKVKRIIGLGGVYGEIPYDKERMVSCNYSLHRMKKEMEQLGVDLSSYHGGASIGSVICKRAGERKLEYTGMYAFAPNYDLSEVAQVESSIRIENDFMAWLAVMRRVNYMLKLDFDLSDLEEKSRQLIEAMDAKIDEIEKLAPQGGVREYIRRLSDEYNENPFNPVDEFWEEKLRGLFDKLEDDGEASKD
jgi:proteasome assembly chaperone (PAC2) family protein